MSIQISIRRYDPESDVQPRWDDYTVPCGDRTTVLEALAYVYENLDPTLAYPFGCRFGACGLCAVVAGASRPPSLKGEGNYSVPMRMSFPSPFGRRWSEGPDEGWQGGRDSVFYFFYIKKHTKTADY